MPDLTNLTPESEKYNKTFFQTTGGMLLTGGLGALIGMGQRHAQKLAMAKSGQQKALANIGAMQMSPESQAAYQASQNLMKQGMGEASRQMAIQENARGFNAGMRMSGIKNKLGMLSAFNSNDFATRLAAENERQRQQNIYAGIQTGLQFGAQKTALDQYKNEQFLNYYLGKQASVNNTLTGALNAVGQIGGQVLTAGLGKPPVPKAG